MYTCVCTQVCMYVREREGRRERGEGRRKERERGKEKGEGKGRREREYVYVDQRLTVDVSCLPPSQTPFLRGFSHEPAASRHC